MRNMSFALTTQQVRERTKTVTRRIGWTFLKPGDLVRAVVKCQGLKKGERLEPIATLRVIDVRRECLSEMIYDESYGSVEVIREGFPRLPPEDFVHWFAATHGCSVKNFITRIEFEYLEDAA